MIAVIDYGVGNIFSLMSSLGRLGFTCCVTGDARVIESSDKLILPGVGAFADAVGLLKSRGLFDLIVSESMRSKPILGICLGMQLLFERSYEFGSHAGLGIIPGEVVPLRDAIAQDLKIPHIGWNALNITHDREGLFKYVTQGDHVYFVHSYYAKTHSSYVSSASEYGIPVTASVSCGNVFGTQFHPEKSGRAGLGILRAFCEMS